MFMLRGCLNRECRRKSWCRHGKSGAHPALSRVRFFLDLDVNKNKNIDG